MMAQHVLDAPVVKGIETLGASSLAVRVETKVAPGFHYDVKRTLNRMLLDAFNANHLQIPYPKSVEISPEPKPSSEPS
jgi:small conductance mechanosensitive channel